jgi:hypothetical protein
MKTTRILAAGALTLGGITAAPALAMAGEASAGTMMAGGGMMAADWRDRPGFCGMDVLDQPSGTLDAAARAELRQLAERAKLAHDLAAAFADRHAAFPAGFAHAQTMRLIMLRVLLDRYGLDDPTRAAYTPAVQAEYDRLLAEGRTGRAAALGVVRRLEQRTVADLSAALERATAPDVRHTYLHLLVAANRLLRAAQAWSGR